MRLAARRDHNEDVLVAIAQKCGAIWVQTGPLDGWCGYRGRFVPVEIKLPKGKYTEREELFIAKCQHAGLPVYTWRTAEDVVKCLESTGS